MSDFKESTIDPTDTADLGRRRALARLGLTAAVAYAAPTLLSLTAAKAKEGESGGGENSGHDGADDDHSGHQGGGNSTPSNEDEGADNNGNDAMNATLPTSPSSDTSVDENT